MNVKRQTTPRQGAPLFASSWLALFCLLRGMLVRQA